MRKWFSSLVSRSSACKLSMPRVWKKSSSGASFCLGTLKWVAASVRTSSSVLSVVVMSIFVIASRQIGQRVVALHKLAQASFHRRMRKKLTKQVDLSLQLLVGDRFDELFCRCGRPPVEFPKLPRGGAGGSQSLAFTHDLADQAHLLRFGRVETASG